MFGSFPIEKTDPLPDPNLACRRSSSRGLRTKRLCCFDYTFPGDNLPAGGTVRKGLAMRIVVAGGMLIGAGLIGADAGPSGAAVGATAKNKKVKVAAATQKFGERADSLLAAAPASKG
jgi:hypothetical protein